METTTEREQVVESDAIWTITADTEAMVTHPRLAEINAKVSEVGETLLGDHPTAHRDPLLKLAVNALAYAIVTHDEREQEPEDPFMAALNALLGR